MTGQTDFSRLYRKFIDGNATEEERQDFFAWLEDGRKNEELEYLIDREILSKLPDEELSPVEKEMMLTHIFNSEMPDKDGVAARSTRRNATWLAVAASVCVAIFGLSYYLLNVGPKLEITQNYLPGGDKAVLKLANGKTVVLSGNEHRSISLDDGSTIIAEGNILTFENRKENDASVQDTGRNLLATPAGGKYNVILPDGTKVWLNASSSISYPNRFSNASRAVEITGEAYFEVFHDSGRPFKVLSKNQMVTVLGTHFNINAYGDEPVTQTVLLQGSVKVTSAGKEKLLKPGQMSSLTNNEIHISDVDAEEAVAWREDYFEFSNTNVAAAMRQLSRWYNVEIQCSEAIAKETITGRISQQKTLKQVIEMIQASREINVTQKGRRIMVQE